MSSRLLAFVLLIGAIWVARSECSRAQEAGTSTKAPVNSTADGDKKEAKPKDESRIATPIGSVVPDEAPLWARETKLGEEFDEVPAITEAFGLEIEADQDVDRAIRLAIESYVCERAENSHAARRLKLTSEDLSAPNIERVKEAVFNPHGDTKLVRKAILIKVPRATRESWLSRWSKLHRQEMAITQTLFVGGGILIALAIFAVHAKVNYSTNGRRSGILRAAAAIAILSLLGGMTTAAVLGRIFSV
jgi:hypothetical protein